MGCGARMTMRIAHPQITICEILRIINDLHQGKTDVDINTRKYLVVAERMAKKMNRKLLEYNKKANVGWWKKNKEYETLLKKRMSKSYLASK